MLKLAWYLITEPDYWQNLPDHPRLAQTSELTDTLHELFGTDAPVDAARTGTAVQILLRMIDYLSDAVPYGRPAVPDRAEYARMLHALNLLLAHTSQITGRLAHHADTTTSTGAGPDLTGLSAGDRETTATALATATGRLTEAAGLLKEAYLAAEGIPKPRH